MNKFEKYMNDPEIVDEPMALREVHAIRLMIYNDTKKMTPIERKAYYNAGLDEVRKKYNFTFVKEKAQ